MGLNKKGLYMKNEEKLISISDMVEQGASQESFLNEIPKSKIPELEDVEQEEEYSIDKMIEKGISQEELLKKLELEEEGGSFIPGIKEDNKMGIAEAALTGVGQGASFGLSPIASGVLGAGIEAVEDIGDVLGFTTDSELKKQGFDVPDDYEGLSAIKLLISDNSM